MNGRRTQVFDRVVKKKVVAFVPEKQRGLSDKRGCYEDLLSSKEIEKLHSENKRLLIRVKFLEEQTTRFLKMQGFKPVEKVNYKEN